MTPRAFIDLHIAGSASDARTLGVDIRATGLVFGVLHGFMREWPGRYAVAFPKGRGFLSVIRVFGSTREDIDLLATSIVDRSAIRDYAIVGYPRVVPEDYTGPWVSYRRYRIPTRKADRKPGAPCRARRMQLADERDLPYLIVRSTSTGQTFGLHFETLEQAPRTQDAQPDGYGLARRSAPFSVPDLPA